MTFETAKNNYFRAIADATRALNKTGDEVAYDKACATAEAARLAYLNGHICRVPDNHYNRFTSTIKR